MLGVMNFFYYKLVNSCLVVTEKKKKKKKKKLFPYVLRQTSQRELITMTDLIKSMTTFSKEPAFLFSSKKCSW